MSGHSHWATTHRQKNLNDAKRGAVFTKYGRAIIIAAESGGGNPDSNFMLRLAIDQARAVNMPKENIDRAIKRGTGELKDGLKIEELTYNAYGPGNVAMLLEMATDNRNRTVSEIKNILAKGDGKFVPAGSVGFIFKRIGRLSFPMLSDEKESLELLAIAAGAEDFSEKNNYFHVYTKPEKLQSVKVFFEKNLRLPALAKLEYLPLQSIVLEANALTAFEKLRAALEDHPDVQMVWDNLSK